MKLLHYLRDGEARPGFLHNSNIIDVMTAAEAIGKSFPRYWEEVIANQARYMPLLRDLHKMARDGEFDEIAIDQHMVKLLAPIQRPRSMRDGYAFRQHVETSRRNRGVEMIPEFDEFPVFYFTNHNAIFGPGEIRVMPEQMKRLDYELEAAIVIGKQGRNVSAKTADDHIFGLMILNDFSAREAQMQEMKLNLGPAKGKDFANAIGPYLVTLDELRDLSHGADKPHAGLQFNLEMKAYLNGELISQGNLNTMNWTFAEIIERVSYGVDIYPNDIIGSGTVGTGCLLEINGTRKLENPDYEPVWLKDGDRIRLEIQELGVLENRIAAIEVKA
ncbi:MAG: fumarylacetoacetate hydrolase family protein [Bacteroidota bacterium]